MTQFVEPAFSISLALARLKVLVAVVAAALGQATCLNAMNNSAQFAQLQHATKCSSLSRSLSVSLSGLQVNYICCIRATSVDCVGACTFCGTGCCSFSAALLLCGILFECNHRAEREGEGN